jgi:phenylacetate-CoA ligase
MTTDGYKRYWDEERETLPADERRRLILKRLRHQLEYAYHKIPFYRRLYDTHRVKPEDMRYLEDFTEKFPIVTKQMLRESQEAYPPFGDFLGIDPSEVFHIHGTSGTTGRPTLFGFSRDDWEFTFEATAMLQWAAGLRPTDVVQITFPLSLFVGGWGILGGAERIGAKVLAIGPGETQRQLTLMQLAKSSVLCATPSYCLYMLEAAKVAGLAGSSASLRLGLFGGEPGAGIPEVKRLIEEGWGMQAIDFGNSAEVHPCSNMECAERSGMHVWNDIVYTEVVAKEEPNRAMPIGSRGALVYTALWRRSQPMIRYWVGDETLMVDEPCKCGRSYPRMPHGVLGRLDDLLIIRGVNVYPSAIEQALRDVPGIGVEYRILVQKKAGSIVDVRIEAECEPTVATRPETFASIAAAAEARLRAVTGVRISVELIEAGRHPRTTLKARRVVELESANSPAEDNL